MKIWFDLSNSPHINMFYDLIKELESEGHEIIITCRPLANTIDLLNQKKLNYTVVGEHYGKNLYKKLFGYPIRVMQLRKFLAKQKPDIAVSQSSFHSPVVAKLLGIPSIYTNDNEHAMGNKAGFYFATSVMIPENLPIANVVKKGASIKRVSHYPGVKEGIYLWQKGERIHKSRENRNLSEVKVYVRPEPLTAQYYKGGLNFLDSTLEQLQDKVSVIVLPRDKTQAAHYKQQKFSRIIVPDKPLEFDQIAEDCTLFIGAGGSMTRELAILGIPTISVYQDELLEVDKFLLEKGAMLHEPNITAEKVLSFLQSLQDKKPDLDLMNKGKEAYQLLKTNIYKFKK
jgi:predicted glycosyltransferase